MPLTIFPAIDLKDGHAVRLEEGDMARATVFNTDPAAQAACFAQAGAQWLHMVDLNGAFAGHSVNADAVKAVLRRFPGKVQLGGGIRTRAAIDEWLGLGVSRVVLGTAALKNPDLVRDAARACQGQIVVAVDAKGGLVVTEGWADASDMKVADLARRFEDAGVAAVLFTDVGRDGLLKGVNLEATIALAEATSLPVIASGGVAGLPDIDALITAREEASGTISGVITGRAIYDGRLDLAKALALVASAG